MQTDLIPLGTASALPANRRHMAAAALQRGGDLLLFDCGEGTQMRISHAGLKAPRIPLVCVTHFHGDHFYGLFGLLATMALLGREDPLTLVGPDGMEGYLRAVPGLKSHWLPYETHFVELPEGTQHAIVFEGDGYRVEARPLEHRVPCFGYRFQEDEHPGHLLVDQANALGITDYEDYRRLKRRKPVTAPDGRVVQPDEVLTPATPGRSFAYILDTRPCDGARALAEGADLVLHEATFLHEMHERAIETGHSTAREAAELARGAGAGRLLLTHFSARYTDPEPLAAEARTVFPNTDAAVELERYAVEPNRHAAGDLAS